MNKIISFLKSDKQPNNIDKIQGFCFYSCLVIVLSIIFLVDTSAPAFSVMSYPIRIFFYTYLIFIPIRYVVYREFRLIPAIWFNKID